MTIAECLRSISFNEIEEILSQYGSQITLIPQPCMDFTSCAAITR